MPKITPTLTAIQIAACSGFLVVQLDVSVVNVGLGALEKAFGADLTDLQWVINSYALVFSALLILGGALGDKLGVRRIFALGFAIFTIASIGCGLSANIAMLVCMRSVQGIGAALLVPTSLTLIRLSFQDAQLRRSAVAMWGACGGIALAAGPVLGGFIVEHLGWPSIFLINVPVGILAIWLSLHFAPESPRIDKAVDLPGQASIAISVALLTYALTQSSATGWSMGNIIAMTGAIVFAVVFFLVERTVKDPMLPPWLVKNHVLSTTSLCGAVINFTFYGTVFILSIYFQTILHYDAVRTGLSFLPLTAVLTISTMASSRIARHVSAPRIIMIGFAIQFVGFIALSQLDLETSFWSLNLALMVVGIGSAMSVPSITNSMLSAVAQRDAGIASGLMASARQLGGVVGVAVFGAMISQSSAPSFAVGVSSAMLLSAASLLIGIAAVFFVLHLQPHGQEQTNG